MSHVPSNLPTSSDSGHLAASTPKRARISEKKRKRARELEQKLIFLTDQYTETELVQLLQRAVADAHRLGQCSRHSDRDLVMQTLEHWGAAEIGDCEEETNLSRWVLDQILIEFEDKKLIGKRPVRDPAGEGGRPRFVYFLIH